MDSGQTVSETSKRPFTETWLPGRDGTKFYTRTYPASPSQAVVIFLHGFSEHIGRYEWAHGVYASRGITIFAFDQRGYGLTALDRQNKSENSKYGKTSWNDQFQDIEWWMKYVQGQYPNIPVFLVGHSMGGALALGFATRKSAPPTRESVSLLAGVLTISPLLILSSPPPRVLRFVGMLASKVAPTMIIPAPVDSYVLTHDRAIAEAYAKDPLCPQKGSLRGMHDMLSGGERIVWTDYQEWPSDLPVLVVHGNEDKVTSFDASQEFYTKVAAKDKEFIVFEGGYHEIVNEPGAMKHKLLDDCTSWIAKHLELMKQL